MATLFDTTVGILTGSQLEDNLEEMLWSLTSIFHRRLTHIQKLLDDNVFEVRESLAIQGGSELASVELERLQMIGLKLWDHRDAFEHMRDLAVDHFSAATGSPWLPRTGSKVSHRGLTSAVVETRSSRPSYSTGCCITPWLSRSKAPATGSAAMPTSSPSMSAPTHQSRHLRRQSDAGGRQKPTTEPQITEPG